MSYRIIEGRTTRCIKLPESVRYQTHVPESEEAVRRQVAREGAVSMEQPLPLNLQSPRNVGVMCRVRNPDQIEPKASRTFSEIYGMMSSSHRVWLCPKWVLLQMGSRNPSGDPLYTSAFTHKPWIWEGCVPFIIRAALNPESVGLQNRRPLPLAFARTNERRQEIWQITKALVERAFEREVAPGPNGQRGGFYDGDPIPENWISYACTMAEPPALTTVQAGQVLGIDRDKPALEDIRVIEAHYFALYAQNDPAKVDAEKNPDLWNQRTEYVKLLTTAYHRLLLERLIIGRNLSHLPARERQIAGVILSLIVWPDHSQIDKGFIRIVWRKDAPAAFRLRRSTIEFQPDESGILQPFHVKQTIANWVKKLYLEPYMNQDYDFDVTVEDFPEDW